MDIKRIGSQGPAEERPPLKPPSLGFWPKKPWIAPSPGTTKLHRRQESLGAASTIPLQGARLPEYALTMTGR